jgi:HAD superfamily hydrolase (TIGR01490 family)
VTPSAAFFDVDGTLVGKNIVHHYFFIRRRMLGWPMRDMWSSLFLSKTPFYYLLDKVSRTQLNVVFYRNYAGLRSDAVRSHAEACFREVIRPNLFSQVSDCIAEHRTAGRQIVLVTGSVDFVMTPLAAFLGVDDMLAPKLVECGGRFTGELDGPPVGDAEKARRVRAYAEKENLSLAASFAYGDSIADLPMLKEVGHPHAVNPDRHLAQAARRSGWPSLRWTVNNGAGADG